MGTDQETIPVLAISKIGCHFKDCRNDVKTDRGDVNCAFVVRSCGYGGKVGCGKAFCDEHRAWDAK